MSGGNEIPQALDLDVECLWRRLDRVGLSSQTTPSRQFGNKLETPTASPVAQGALEDVCTGELLLEPGGEVRQGFESIVVATG